MAFTPVGGQPIPNSVIFVFPFIYVQRFGRGLIYGNITRLG